MSEFISRMGIFLNLLAPWLILGVIAVFQPETMSPNSWVLQGLQAPLPFFGISISLVSFGVWGILIPLAILHNLTFVVVRVIQRRMHLDFLPMIGRVLFWVGVGLFAYGSWLSFTQGANFGEFQPKILMLFPLLALSICLAFFYKPHDRNLATAQFISFVVAWAPMFSIVATLAGNRLRPPSLFHSLHIEPGNKLMGWNEMDEKVRIQGFLRLIIKKEGLDYVFPALAHKVKFDFENEQHVSRVTSQLSPIPRKIALELPLSLERSGWRPTGEHLHTLKLVCSKSPNISLPITLRWNKSDAEISLKIEDCREDLIWSMEARSNRALLGSLDLNAALDLKQRREKFRLPLESVDLKLLSEVDWRQRKLGLMLLSQVEEAAVVPILVQSLYDMDLEVRRTAAIALVSWGSRVEVFLEKALRDPNPFVRSDALRIVSLAMRNQAHPIALRFLHDKDTRVRVSAVQSLSGWIKDDIVFKTFIHALELQLTAFELKKSPFQESEFLKDPFVSELIRVIASTQDPRAASVLLRSIPKVLAPEGSEYSSVQTAAAESLRNMKNWLGLDYLQAMFRHLSPRQENLSTREKALSIMSRWRESGDESVYLRALNDPQLRPHALSLLDSFRTAEINAAVEKLSSPKLSVR